MSDIIDRATEYMEKHPVIAPNNNFDKPSLTHCIDCDDPIPEKRRLYGGVERCIDCQEYQDNKL